MWRYFLQRVSGCFSLKRPQTQEAAAQTLSPGSHDQIWETTWTLLRPTLWVQSSPSYKLLMPGTLSCSKIIYFRPVQFQQLPNELLAMWADLIWIIVHPDCEQVYRISLWVKGRAKTPNTSIERKSTGNYSDHWLIVWSLILLFIWLLLLCVCVCVCVVCVCVCCVCVCVLEMRNSDET